MRIILLCLLLSGCAYLPLLPTYGCEHVKYERIGNQVEMRARCAV
jgi:hypothetical protein